MSRFINEHGGDVVCKKCKKGLSKYIAALQQLSIYLNRSLCCRSLITYFFSLFQNEKKTTTY